MEGWIKLHRKLSDNPLWKCEPFTRGQAWIDLILLTNHEKNFFYKRGVKIELDRSQCGWSELALSERWKWSRSKVRKFLKDLEKEHQITQHKSNVTQIITLINYDTYQEKVQQKDTKNTPKGQQKDTNKNDKNEKNEKEKNILFENFWEKYHSTTRMNKTDKDSALSYWNKLNMNEKLKAEENISNYYNSLNDKKYCKKARTYLADKNFNDEFNTKSSKLIMPD